MRAAALGTIVIAGLVWVAGAAPAPARDAAAPAHRGRIVLLASNPGHVTIAFLKLQLKGKYAARAPLHPKFRFTSAPAARRTIVLAAVHTKRKQASVTYSMLFTVLTPARRQLVGVSSSDVEPKPLVTLIDSSEDLGRFFVFVLTGIDTGRIADEEAPVTSGSKSCPPCGEFEQVSLANADTSPKRTTLDDTIAKLASDTSLGDSFNPLQQDQSLDTGHYDDGHAFGWKQTQGKGANWVKLTDGLLDAAPGDVATAVGDLFEEAGQPAPPPPEYTCGGAQTLLFDNFNGDPVEGGGTPPTFSTGGKKYCLDMVATYHWNNGKGEAPGSIGLGTLGPWKAVGGAGQGGARNVDWIAKPLPGQPVILDGSYTCKDSSPATWSKNATSGGHGFCRVWVREAQKI